MTIATGQLAAPFLEKLVDKIWSDIPRSGSRRIRPSTTNFSERLITVSGLLTGQDLIEQLKDGIWANGFFCR